MNFVTKVLATGALSALLAVAGDAAGTIGSVEGLKLNGQAVPAKGVKAWPVTAGDEVRSGNVPTMLTLKDGSRVMLGANSRARVNATGSGTELMLLNGSIQYKTAPDSSLRFASPSGVVPTQAGSTGQLQFTGADLAASPIAVQVAAPVMSDLTRISDGNTGGVSGGLVTTPVVISTPPPACKRCK